ncbi:NUDIX domain-containing protein [Alicyclobacillus sacchari]|uniref:NUDIX domain-containing protein n=1 Tax=Alicyclobacillus sacchari TaxID=392010 RepID=A0A4R8LQ91_9BACL|nr:NUDIX hydrolase [Alicyclobacillus sacchari]TDY49709.1 NUDIX domain-containing protein [Alicyclobacillus sacchari]
MEKRGPWSILRSEVKYRNPWISVVEHQVLRPDGKPGIYGVIDAGHNAATVAIDSGFNAILLDEFVFPFGVVQPQIPSGQFRDDEDPQVAAARELLEETGIAATSWVSLGTFQLSGGISTQVSHLFLAQELSFGERRLEGTEQIEMRKVPVVDAIAMCLDGRIQDSVSLVGLLRAAEWLRQRGIWQEQA